MVFSHVLVRHLPKKYLSHKDIRDYMTPPAPGSFALLPVSPQEIIDTPIAGISKSTRSAGPDGVDPLVARNTVVNIAEVLSDIINSSFVTGHIPQQLKIVKITPIFKQGDKMITSNYRPISILSYFAKIMKRPCITDSAPMSIGCPCYIHGNMVLDLVFLLIWPFLIFMTSLKKPLILANFR